MVLPIYKLLSLFLRVFSRPLISYTKKYHASNKDSIKRFQSMFIFLGQRWHKFETRINRKYLKTSTQNIVVKPISHPVAIQKGIEFFYEILFYSIAIGFPLYELYRAGADGKEKEKKMNHKITTIETKVEKIASKVHQMESWILQQQINQIVQKGKIWIVGQ